ncbi:alpha-L-fucosidase [Lederbergia wuyishanensis]|uniref:alpha-L-fucosidase n=1 Tax=Lederbergia wuyishanensis TaxID=1347903 RepID=A0ABU0D457_9BACI|nr:alpha-L-fucosidase [Lederbergia wuyishanensis]MCJ8008240.1 alpha-L-fucosidase [Lederbergia wuyishanensis]MDQ0343171.1 alpha-L-fucosidase [Lederbergia wuyishanensis]
MTSVSEISKTSNWPTNYGDPTWLLHDRFGLFIHWGLYSNAARHEWVMNREKIHPDTYRKYFKYFDPDLYDPKIWARAAKEAGMKYFVITTKHHEGFALWDSALTDYKVTNTPAKRDVLLEMVNAFREEGLKVGFYHSVIDWHHPEFPIDGLHPQRDDEVFKANAQNRKIENYAEYLHGQVRELLTNYGKIDYLWFDFSYPTFDWGWSTGKGKIDWQSEKLEKMVLELQPDILLNDRLDLGRGVITPEQYQPREVLEKDGNPVIWEACQTLNGSWGYDRDNLDWKSDEMLIKMLVDTVSKGGNLLLNVGPNARGEIDEKSLNSLRAIGQWMRLNSRSIYGATNSDLLAPVDCRYTQKGNRLYLHIFSWPFRHIHLDGLSGKIDYAQLLHDASEVQYKEHDPNESLTSISTRIKPGSVTLELPIQKPDIPIPVVEIFLKD